MTYEDVRSTSGDGMASEALPASALITIAVCSYGRPTLLNDLLPKLLNDQHGVSSDDYRICVVENSDDSTHFDDLVAAFGHVSNLTILRSTPPGIAHARNVALEVCDTPYIAYLDDDAVPEPRWVERLTRAFLDHRPSVVAGPIRPDWPGPEPAWLPPKYAPCLAILDYGDESRWLTGEEFAYGANMAFAVEPLREIGGFNVGIGQRGGTNLLREGDIEPQILLSQRGHRAWYAADASVTHTVHADRLTRNWFRSRMTWQAVSSLLRNPPLNHVERSPQEIRTAAEKLGVSELVAKLVEPGDRQSFSTQLDLIYHLFALMLEAKDLDDAVVEQALSSTGPARAGTPDQTQRGPERPAAGLLDFTAPIHLSTRHLFVDGQPSHFFLYSLYGSLPHSQLLSLPYPLWRDFEPALDCLQRSLQPTVQTVTFVTLDPLIYGPSKPSLMALLRSTGVAFFGILHRPPENREQEAALKEAVAYFEGIFVLAEPLADILSRAHGIANVHYLPANASLSKFVQTDRDAARNKIGARDGQTVFSVLGQLRAGKGFDLLLNALDELSHAELEDMLFLIAGRPEGLSAEFVSRSLDDRGARYYLDLRSSKNPFKYNTLTDRELGEYLSASDVGLLLYDQAQQSCMSGLVPNFVVANKSLIASSDSVVGQLVEAYDLGLAVDAHSPVAVAEILRSAPARIQDWSPTPAYARYRESISDEAILEALSRVLNEGRYERCA